MGTILIVDDEEPILDFMKASLSEFDLVILTARSSDEAFQISRQYRERIDLLVTDMKMDPYMSGTELAQCMRQLRAGIKILYVSGFNLEGDALAEVENGEADFLPKPFSPEALRAKTLPLLADSISA